jgi:hypothetical protein
VSVSITNILVLIIFWTQISDTIAKHLVGIVFVKDEKEPRVLAVLDQLLKHLMRINGLAHYSTRIAIVVIDIIAIGGGAILVL